MWPQNHYPFTFSLSWVFIGKECFEGNKKEKAVGETDSRVGKG